MSLLRYLRPALLVAIIVLTGPVVRAIVFADTPFAEGERLQQWFWLVLAMAAFFFCALAGREGRDPNPALVVEGVLATVFFVTPPLMWFRWFGVNVFVDASGGTLGAFGLMQPLSAMWLGIVVATARSQWKRGAAASASASSSGGAEHPRADDRAGREVGPPGR